MKLKVQHVFLIGAKSMGAYGGYETFVNKLTEYHSNRRDVQYHVAVKKNGQGAHYPDGAVRTSDGYIYHNAHCFEIPIPEKLGAAQAVYYDCAALSRGIRIIREQNIKQPVIYIMTCRIGLLFWYYRKRLKKLGAKLYLNPDGHEWKRTKWSAPVRAYWRYSESAMVRGSDLIVCDSVNIEKYIQAEYPGAKTAFIAYGAETGQSTARQEDLDCWLNERNIRRNGYYLMVSRCVPENNYETIIREFMRSHTQNPL